MEEECQLNSALKHLPFGKHVTLLTDARFSGASTGADPDLPDDTRLWAALQAASGGAWRGSICDVDRIVETLQAEMEVMALAKQYSDGRMRQDA